jgi:hypothetical protein
MICNVFTVCSRVAYNDSTGGDDDEDLSNLHRFLARIKLLHWLERGKLRNRAIVCAS